MWPNRHEAELDLPLDVEEKGLIDVLQGLPRASTPLGTAELSRGASAFVAPLILSARYFDGGLVGEGPTRLACLPQTEAAVFASGATRPFLLLLDSLNGSRIREVLGFGRRLSTGASGQIGVLRSRMSISLLVVLFLVPIFHPFHVPSGKLRVNASRSEARSL